MAEDTLVVGVDTDISGLVKGLDLSEAKIRDFQQQVNTLAKALPGIDPKDFMSGVRAGIRDGIRDLDKAERSTKRLAGGFEVGRQGGRRLESSLAAVALSASGITGPMARVTEGLVLFAGAGLPLLELAGVIGVVTVAYGVLTKATHDAAKEQDDLAKKLHQRITGETPEKTQIFHEVSAAIGEQAKAQLEVNKIQKEENQLLKDPMFSLANQFRLRTLNVEMAKRQFDIDKGIADLGRSKAPALIAGLGTELAGLSQSPAQAADAARRNTIATTDMTEAQRKAALVLADLIFKHERNTEVMDAAAKSAEVLARFNDDLTRSGQEASNQATKLSHDFADKVTKGWEDARKAAEDYAKATQGAQEGLLKAEDIHAEFLDKQRQAFLDVADAAAGVVQTANAVGLIGDNAAQALLDVVNLADALNKISLQGAGLANVLGGIGAGLALAGSVISIGKGLFGQTATDREHDQILKENNQRLLELRTSMDQSLQGIAGAQRAQDVLKVTNVLGNVGGVGKVPGHLGPSADLEKALADAGLSLEQFALIVQQQTGIQILDKEGRIAAASWEIARKAMEEHTRALEAATLAEQQAEKAARTRQAQEDALQASIDASNAAIALLPTLRDLKRQLEGSTDDVQKQFDDMVAQLGIVAPDFAQMFAGIDLSDPAAREAFRKKMLDAVDQLMGPGFENLDPEAKQTFLDFLKQGADILDGFNSSVQDATKSLTNMPVGINLAALEFQAQAAGGGPKTGSSFPTAGFPGGGTSGNTTVSSFTWTGDIVVQGAGKNAAEIAREVKDTLKRQSLAKTGSPDNWGV